MQRHLKYTAPVLTLSAEEQAIDFDEQNENAIEIEKESVDIERLGDIVTTMGEVQTVVSNTPDIKPIDQALVEAAADMAVAGTDANPEEVVADMAPATGVSAEGFFDTITTKLQQIWEKIKELISKAWESIKKFFGFNKNKLDEAEKKFEKAKATYEEVKKGEAPTDPVAKKAADDAIANIEAAGKKMAEEFKTKMAEQSAQSAAEEEAKKMAKAAEKAKATKPKAGPRRIDFWGTAGNIAIDGKLVEPEKLAEEIRRLSGAVEKGVNAMLAGQPMLYDNVKRQADLMGHALNGKQTQATYESFMAAYKDGGAKHRQTFQKMAQDGGFQKEGSQKNMLADFALLYTEKDSHSSNWNDVDLWVDMAGNGYNNVRADGIREIPLDIIQNVFDAVDAGFDVSRKLEKTIGSDFSMNSHRSAVSAAMDHLSKAKPTAEDTKNETDDVQGLSPSAITGAVQQMGFAVFNMAKIGGAINKAILVMVKVLDTSCMYAERSLAPASE